jgi:hypothetical protein
MPTLSRPSTRLGLTLLNRLLPPGHGHAPTSEADYPNVRMLLATPPTLRYRSLHDQKQRGISIRSKDLNNIKAP